MFSAASQSHESQTSFPYKAVHLTTRTPNNAHTSPIPSAPCPPTTTTAPALLLQLPGIAGGFVAAYGLWSVLTKDSATKLPHTITNPEWAAATKGACLLCSAVWFAAVLAGWAQLRAFRADDAAHALPVSVAASPPSLPAVPLPLLLPACRAAQGAAPHCLRDPRADEPHPPVLSLLMSLLELI
jgi:hypothetical protein